MPRTTTMCPKFTVRESLKVCARRARSCDPRKQASQRKPARQRKQSKPARQRNQRLAGQKKPNKRGPGPKPDEKYSNVEALVLRDNVVNTPNPKYPSQTPSKTIENNVIRATNLSAPLIKRVKPGEYIDMGQIEFVELPPGQEVRAPGFWGCSGIIFQTRNKIIVGHITIDDEFDETHFNENDLEEVFEEVTKLINQHGMGGPGSNAAVMVEETQEGIAKEFWKFFIKSGFTPFGIKYSGRKDIKIMHIPGPPPRIHMYVGQDLVKVGALA